MAACREAAPSLESTMSDELKSQIKQAIVRSLKLPIDPNEIDSAAPLFGAGLGLDSIDALELVLELERSFGVVVGDEQTGGQVLRSVDAIAEFVTAQRASAGFVIGRPAGRPRAESWNGA